MYFKLMINTFELINTTFNIIYLPIKLNKVKLEILL